MPKLNASAVVQYEQDKVHRQQELEHLMSKPFDVNNPEHMSAVRRYVNEYEFQSHQMYVFQALGELVKFWGVSWAISFFLPVPELVSDLLAYGLYIGGGSLILKGFNHANFMEQTKEMRELYNWCLKDGQEFYNNSIDNTDVLKNADIQRFIRTLAPLSTAEFMLAWPRVTEVQDQQSGMLMSAYNSVASVASYGASFFRQAQPSNPSLDAKINQLKADVELGQCAKGSFEGVKQAIEYYSTSSEFRKLMTEKAWNVAKEPIAMVREQIPAQVSPHLKIG